MTSFPAAPWEVLGRAPVPGTLVSPPLGVLHCFVACLRSLPPLVTIWTRRAGPVLISLLSSQLSARRIMT